VQKVLLASDTWVQIAKKTPSYDECIDLTVSNVIIIDSGSKKNKIIEGTWMPGISLGKHSEYLFLSSLCDLASCYLLISWTINWVFKLRKGLREERRFTDSFWRSTSQSGRASWYLSLYLSKNIVSSLRSHCVMNSLSTTSGYNTVVLSWFMGILHWPWWLPA